MSPVALGDYQKGGQGINKRLSSRQIYHGRIINLRVDEVELPDGRQATREIVEHPGACVIVPVDENGMVYLVRQYRDAAGRDLLELPAGKLKPDEEPLAGARRECLEELGLTAGSWQHLSSFYSTPGFCNEMLHCYLAQELSAAEKKHDREEFLETVIRPLRPAGALLGELQDAKSLAGIQLALRVLDMDIK